MQLTPNYKLKKPEGTDPVDIQDFNDNADLIDAALKKKAETSGGDISEMTVKTLDTITTEFPVPVAGESQKSFLGKVKKFFEDTKNWMTGVCLIGQIVNNCVTNNAKLPLSAAQGKVLMDLYTVLNNDLGATAELISIKNIGIRFGSIAINQVANGTGAVTLDLSSIFVNIISATGTARTTIPGDKNAGVTVDGTKITFYLYNGTSTTSAISVLYIVIGTLK
ncbi:hypothetical protein [Enterocloster citroniae]|uniref:hypothetical protein n=1 Tax=Enterocloster citroniae TaxID=358743 RepID=UPI00349EA2E9